MLNILKKLFAIGFITIFSLPFFILSIIVLFSDSNPQIRSANNCINFNSIREITFVRIDNFYRENSRIPSWSEFHILIEPLKQNFDGRYIPLEGINLKKSSDKDYKDIYQKFGNPTPNKAFTIECWDGDRYSYYIPWAGNGNISYVPYPRWYFYNSKSKDIRIYVFLGLLFFTIGMLLFIEKK